MTLLPEKMNWKDPEQVRTYHREYRRRNKDRINAQLRERYTSDPNLRKSLKNAQAKYLATEKGQTTRQLSKEAFLAKNPDYHKDYAKTNSEEAVKRSRQWREQHPEEFRELMRIAAQRRRAIVNAAFVEDVHSLVVLERDDGCCGICGGDVDPTDFHVDHIIPLSKGGEHSYANVQAAHPSCNVRKGAS